ncbi:hypothetical protein LTR95_012347, partial [Oleoguttula sp. CCFEE 5521]
YTNTLEIWKKRPDSPETGKYVAVSYCWDPTPGLESNQAGEYSIKDARGSHFRYSKARDNVLTRTIRYARCKNVSRLWIDGECIPQVESEEKRTALDSMDLVYSRSKYPVGLLATFIETQDEANILQDLLDGEFSNQSNVDDYPILTHPRHSKISIAVFNLLERLHGDRWWTRAWIFQEEYLSSTAMHILARCRPGIAIERKFGILRGEICFNAAKFREQATLFLLAFKRGNQPKQLRKCAKMLKRFGKYSVLYHFQHGTRRKAMSPRIIADVQPKGLRDEYDRLPILAKSCNYGIRMSPPRQAIGGYIFGLWLLAMYLLNGKLLRRPRDVEKVPTEMDVCNHLQYISFDHFDPPVQAKQLSY